MDMPKGSWRLCLKVFGAGPLVRPGDHGTSHRSPLQSLLRFRRSWRWRLSAPRDLSALADLAHVFHLRAAALGSLSHCLAGVCASIMRPVVVMAALSEPFLSLDTTTPSPPQSQPSNPLVFSLQVAN